MGLNIFQMPDTDIVFHSNTVPNGMDNPPSRVDNNVGNTQQTKDKPKRRKRRTKAEIEADRAKELANKNKVAEPPATITAQDNIGSKLTEEKIESVLSGAPESAEDTPPWESASTFNDFGWCKVWTLSSIDRCLIHEDENFLIFKKM